MTKTLTALAVGALIGATGAWAYSHHRSTAAARVEAERHAAVLKRHIEQLDAAQARGDALTRELAAAVDQSNILQKERDDALSRLTTGRECLSGAAVGVLNRRASAVRVPTPTRQPAADPAARAATDPHQPAASDRDVAIWASDAQRRYAECAATLRALVGWHESEMQSGGMP